MNKLKKEDIKVLGEGPQVAKAIKATYNSIEDFYSSNDTPFTLSSLRTYLSRNVITSDSFKCSITKILNTDFYKIVLTPKEQISVYAHDVYENIRQYTEEEDSETLDSLLELCKQEDLTIEISMMYRAKARNCYYTNKINHTEEFYEYAIETLPDDEVNLKAFFSAELAFDFYRENMLPKADKKYQIAKSYLDTFGDKLDIKTHYYYYYWRGILYSVTDKLSMAIEYFETAKKYAVQNFEKAGSIANIGLCYKKMKAYEKALKYYKEALNYYDESRISTTGVIYNNMAELYRTNSDYRNALIYIHEALDCNEKDFNLTNHLLFLSTYVEIQMELGSYLSYEAYFEVLLNTRGKQLDKIDIVNNIKSFISTIGRHGNSEHGKECLNKLSDIIIQLKNASDKSGYIQGLYECLGHIYENLKKLNKEVIA